MPRFTTTEKLVIKLFAPNKEIEFEGDKYIIRECTKPRPSSGECKTDVYVKLESDNGIRELKISIKQKNADFIENKIKYERAKEILGNDVDNILKAYIYPLKEKFLKQHLVVFDKYRNTHAKSIKLGWRFELVNKSRGDLCGILNLNPRQLKDIYTGQNLPDSKRNAYVSDKIVNESGVANYILVIDQQKNITLKGCLESLTPIDEYLLRHPNIYFACKALNYRVGDGKWEGDRALAVYVDWIIVDGKMTGNLIFDNPLQKTGNEIGENVKKILNDLKISNDNFRTLKAKLHDNVKFYEK